MKKLEQLDPKWAHLRDTLAAEIKKRNVNKDGAKSRKISNTPWTRLPNCSDFKIKLGKYNLLFYLKGILKKCSPKVLIKSIDNDGMNRYMRFQIKRLRSKLDNPVLFWKIATILMKRSNVFRVSAINHVFPNWYKSYPFWWILQINRKASRIINSWDDNFEFRRVYIPKGETNHRPRLVGVPKPEWRLVLHIWANFLHIFLEENLLQSQHGFIPGRGCLTAWRYFFHNKIHEKRYIYECDLKDFFGSIHLNYVTEKLISLGVPKQIAYYLENINRNTPQLPAEQKLDESKYTLQETDEKEIKEGTPSSTDLLAPIR